VLGGQRISAQFPNKGVPWPARVIQYSNRKPGGRYYQAQRDTLDAIRDINLRPPVEKTVIRNIHRAFTLRNGRGRAVEPRRNSFNLNTASEATLMKLSGRDRDQPSFARNCCLGRRLVRARQCRFGRFIIPNWGSAHGGTAKNLQGDFEKSAAKWTRAGRA